MQYDIDIIVVTTNDIPNKTIVEIKGMVHGLIVRTPTITQGFLGNLKNPSKEIKIGLIGKYIELKDAYKSIN